MRDLVVKDNALINASYNLDLVEQRLILLAIVEARESGRGINTNDPLEVHAESYINQFQVARQTAYQALKDACKDLFARQFSYQEINKRGNIENVLSRWVSEIRYIDDEATVKLIFAPAIVPLITRLEEQFTKYELQQISNLSSAYAVRLYELLIAWRSTGQTPIIELAEFRKKIGVLDDEYTRMGNFKDRVLNLAVAQVNEHTDIKVKCEQHKRGRNIAGFSFSFKQKKDAALNTINKNAKTLDVSLKLTDAQRHMFAHKMSELPEMSKYSQGTESYPQFAVRIAEMLQDSERLKELLPYLIKVGYMPLDKKDTVNG
ncbi:MULTISPECIES: replication initiation protein RepM [Acinetobacter]|uniref:Replication initiation protein n=1 Tax=Acinetobacter piscicola TaxID=2006115 RepID=A0A7S6W0P3_9GAMM|nr:MULTISPECIES: replication initiation protein RepM [Acinetobacter]QOW48272.1 replication initiation protein [Acinetobacter piscicola]